MKLNFDTLSLPDDGPTEEQIRRCAFQLRIPLERLVTRALIEYVERVSDQMTDPKLAARFRPDGEKNDKP